LVLLAWPPRPHAKNEASTRQFSPLSLRAMGVSTPGRLAVGACGKEMESRPVIADEQSLERLEDEEQEEEEDLDVVVDDIDDELDILGEEDLVEEDEEESAEAEEENDEAVEDEDEADDVVDDSDSTSLEELLAQRTASRQVSDDPDEDEDLLALSSEARRKASPPKSKVTPLRNREEFVCKRCFLLKPKVQLADSERMLCRDCV